MASSSAISRTVLIIGGVAAGATAAARARRVDEHARIIVLEAGGYISFANCGLPYYLGREISDRNELILQQPEDFRRRYRVEVYPYTEALAIDRASRVVSARRFHPTLDVAEELEFDYDTLILAQGGRPVRPALPGAELPHVFPLWTIPEMDALDAAVGAARTRSAAVLGGGFIGLETAEALRRRGLDVSIIEMAPHVMPNLDTEIAAALEQELRHNGVKVYSGRRASRITADEVVLDDQTAVAADLVVLSVGVAPTLQLAREAQIGVGSSGGIAVDQFLRTSDPAIFAAGDMIEITHRVSGNTQRLPLAGPANRQGRIAGNNAVSDPECYLRYRGSVGTSVIKLFSLEAGSTGLSTAQAVRAGIEAHAVTVHKLNHAGYYPGARDLTLKLLYAPSSGRVLGAQAVGTDVDKRIDVVATALAAGMTIDDLAELDLAYAPPFSSANDPVNIAAFAAQNRRSGAAAAITVDELDSVYRPAESVILDVRTAEEFEAGNVEGALNIEIDQLRERLGRLDRERPILVHCAAGYRAHLAVRILRQHGFTDVTNILGGFTSIERHAALQPFARLKVNFAAVAQKRGQQPQSSSHVVVDVRSPEEYRAGHIHGAFNIPVNEIMSRYHELAETEERIVLYCASGSRSEYARMILNQLGVTNVENGGGYQEMLRKYPAP